MRWVSLFLALVMLGGCVCTASPQGVLRVKVMGNAAALNGQVYFTFSRNGLRWETSCLLRSGECALDVGGGQLRVLAVRFEGSFVAVRVRGSEEAAWIGFGEAGAGQLVLHPVSRGFLAELSVAPAASGGELYLEIEARKAYAVVLDRGPYLGLYVPSYASRYGVKREGGRFLIVVPEGASAPLPLRVDSSSRLGGLVAELSKFGVFGGSGWVGRSLTCWVRQEDNGSSLAAVAARCVREAYEEHLEWERGLLSRMGFNAEEYLVDAYYALQLLREGEAALAAGKEDVGLDLVGKGLSKAVAALSSLGQAKSDSIVEFLLLIAFSFFVSAVAANLVEKRGRFVGFAVFAGLLLLEVALIPGAKMAVALLSPQVVGSLPPRAVLVSVLIAGFLLVFLLMLAFSAKGSMLADFFWLSVKNMRRRRLRAVLTLSTVAVVTAVSAAFLAVGASTSVNVKSYPSSFKGVSVSLHVSTLTYVTSGSSQTTQVVFSESYVPLPAGEVKWLAGFSWVDKVYLLMVGKGYVERGGARVPAFVAATNGSSLAGAAVPRSLAGRLGVSVGDSILVSGHNVTVAAVFDDSSPPPLVDGVPVVEASAPMVVVPLWAAPKGSAVYRVILEGSPPEGVSESLVRMSYIWSSNVTVKDGAQVGTHRFESYRACVGDGASTRCLVIMGEFERFAGAPEVAVMLILSSLTVVSSLLGSMHERRREYSTFSALGASPGHIAAMVLVEGASYGFIGGTAGYLLSEFLRSALPVRALSVHEYAFSPALVSVVVAVVPAFIGSLIPAREAASRVVPSRVMGRRESEVRLLEDAAETVMPLRISGDERLFVEYLESLTRKPPSVGWGPRYLRVESVVEGGRVSEVRLLVDFRSERAASFLVRVFLPREKGATVRVRAEAAGGVWDANHRACARDFMTALRGDLLRYVEWKKEKGGVGARF